MKHSKDSQSAFTRKNRDSLELGELVVPPKDFVGTSPQRKSPLPHQKAAVADIVKALSISGDNLRAQVHMACGTGKTMVGLWTSERLQSANTLVCEPSLALIRQNLLEWKGNCSGLEPAILVVCSDPTVVSPNQDSLCLDLAEIPARVTNDVREIARFLAAPHQRRLVFSTYHSLHLLGKAMRQAKTNSFDLAIADEAHRTASRAGGAFTVFHDNDIIRSRCRLYMTATPVVYQEAKDEQVSMDDTSIFGKVVHSLPFSEAVEKNLLTDYRVVVATLPESYLKEGRITQLTQESQFGLAQVATLRAAKKYGLTKLLTFHSTVAKAQRLAVQLEQNAHKYQFETNIWAHAVDGRMTSSTRNHLLSTFAENSSRTVSVIANCRCLTEGVDLPAIDGVVFFDPKKSQIDIIQAVGRAIRRASGKAFGTIIVPVVIPRRAYGVEHLEKSKFAVIAQVLRALRAHDDRFDLRLKQSLGAVSDVKSGHQSKTPILFTDADLDDGIRQDLRTKVVKMGLGIRHSIWTEEMIIKAAMRNYRETGTLPSGASSQIAPEFGITWNSLDSACRAGYHGIEKGRSLSEILTPVRKSIWPDFTVEGIVEAGRSFCLRTGRMPMCGTEDKVPGYPNDTWARIDSCARDGNRGLAKGQTLRSILSPLFDDPEVLAILGGVEWRSNFVPEEVYNAAREFCFKYHKIPSQHSREEVPGHPGETWARIDRCGRAGHRGLEKGQSLAVILAPLRQDPEILAIVGNNIKRFPNRVKRLTEEGVRKAAVAFQKATGSLPNTNSREPIPGFPGISWRYIDRAALQGKHGLKGGQRLSDILAPLCNSSKRVRDSDNLSDAAIIHAARLRWRKFHSLPTSKSRDPVPGLPHESWIGIHNALYKGSRGLPPDRSLSILLAPLRVELAARGKL